MRNGRKRLALEATPELVPVHVVVTQARGRTGLDPQAYSRRHLPVLWTCRNELGLGESHIAWLTESSQVGRIIGTSRDMVDFGCLRTA